MDDQLTIEKVFDALSKNAPEILTRQKIHEFSGGLISAKTLANLDSSGEGVVPRLRIGGKVAYPKEAVIEFLKRRCQIF